MADAGASGDVAKAIGDPLGTLVGWLAELLPQGPARTLLYVVVGLCVAVAPFIYKYYLGVLAQGAAPKGSLERQDYDKLRASLAGGNLAARLYARWLERFLDAVDRFFGDVGMADRTLFPRAFWLQKPAPLWTAPAFDRCLFLALIYPIATIFVIWAISGHVGPAEAALGLKPDISGWARGLAVAAIGFSSFALRRGTRARGWKSRFLIAVAAAVAGAVAFAFAFPVAVDCVTEDVFVVFAFNSTALVGAFAFAVAFPAFVGGGVAGLSALAIEHRLQGVFLSLFLLAMILVCLAGAVFISYLAWGLSGPLLLFLGLLTLLNAPFDWRRSA